VSDDDSGRLLDGDGDHLRLRLLLDVSTITAFGVNIGVGEVIREITEDETDDGSVPVFGLTGPSLAAAYSAGTEISMLNLLGSHPNCVLIEQAVDTWQDLGRFMRHSPGKWHDVHAAFLAQTALQLGAYIFTAAPDTYQAYEPHTPVLLLENPFGDSR
jgi:hypothetical protein